MKSQREALSNILEDDNLSIFEKKVYKAVSKIPKGEVRSYKWVAKALGAPKAARAVGGALNRNPYPKVIPCHRVINRDGSIGGYSKGIAAKRRFLIAGRVQSFMRK